MTAIEQPTKPVFDEFISTISFAAGASMSLLKRIADAQEEANKHRANITLCLLCLIEGIEGEESTRVLRRDDLPYSELLTKPEV